jgi:hypothetical protein
MGVILNRIFPVLARKYSWATFGTTVSWKIELKGRVGQIAMAKGIAYLVVWASLRSYIS